MRFEKFYLIDMRGNNGRPILKLINIKDEKDIEGNTAMIIKILQCGEMHMQTRFANKKFIDKYAKAQYRNLRSFHVGDPINVFSIPVAYSAKKKKYIMKFDNDN